MSTVQAAPDISPRELARRLSQADAVILLDVREPVERQFCAIPVHPGVHDLHIPISQIVARFDDLRGGREGTPIVVYCHHGVRSRMVVDWLLQQGIPGLMNLEGGIDAWSLEVDPLLPRY